MNALGVQPAASAAPRRAKDQSLAPPVREAAVPLWAWAVWVLAVMASAAFMPFDASYDVAHYHIHNGWAAWNGRLDKDFAPADMHSFINPAYNVIVWWLIERLPGPFVNSVLAIPMALIAPALYYLTRTFSILITGRASRAVCLTVALAGLLAEGNFAVFASIRNDSWGAAGFLGALALSLTVDGRLAGWRRLVISSLILGALLGMKWTNGAYVVAYGVFVLVLAEGWQARIRAGLICALAGGLAVLAMSGPYAWILWQRFGNPIFPLANDVFASPFGPEGWDAYARRKPEGPLGFLAYPFIFTLDSTLIGSADYKDPRFLLTYLSAPLLIAAIGFRWRDGNAPEWGRPVLAVSLVLIVGILVWMQVFPVLRYMLAAWILGPFFVALLLFAGTGRAALTARLRRIGFVAVACLLIASNTTGVRRAHWDGLFVPYVSAEIADMERFENAFVLIAGDTPSAFLVPLFPETATFGSIIPQDYFAPALENYRPLLRAAMAEAPERPIYVLIHSYDRGVEELAKLAAREQLYSDPAACEDVPNNFTTEFGGWVLCRVYRPSETRLDAQAALRLERGR